MPSPTTIFTSFFTVLSRRVYRVALKSPHITILLYLEVQQASMAEVLAVAGGVASFAHMLDTAIKSSKALAKFYHDFHNAPAEQQRVQLKCCVLKTILEDVQNFLTDFPDDVVLPLHLRQTLFKACDLVRCDIAALQQTSHSYALSSSKSVRKRLRWVLVDKHSREEILQHLKDSENTLSDALQWLNL
jgi:hypothetical protein